MIPVTLDDLIFIYLALMLSLVCGAWLFSAWRQSRREREAFRHVIHCKMCGFDFQDPELGSLSRCPRCAALNERARHSRL
jgi:hypothetical protein